MASMASTSSAGSAKRKRVSAEGVGADIIDIECPVCMELMTGTINQCAKGHTLCGACTSKVTTCPSCRCDMDTENPIRCLFAMRVAETVKVPCEHEGCSEVVPAKELKGHMAGCEHASYKCPSCEEEVAGAELWGHIKEKHKQRLMEHTTDWKGKSVSFFWDLESGELGDLGAWEPFYLEVPDGGFVVVDMSRGGKRPSVTHADVRLVRGWSDAHGCMNVCARQMAGGGSPPKMVTVHLLEGNRKAAPRPGERCRRVTHCYEAQSLRRTPQEVLDAGGCMSVGLKEVEKMAYKGREGEDKFNIVFEIE